METVNLRKNVMWSDKEHVESIVRSTGFFREDEVLIAVELVEEYLKKGTESGYEFIFAEVDGETVGYSCFGLIPCTLHSFDLYWIATHNDFHNRGIGKKLLLETEIAIRKLGGHAIYAETSSKELYAPTRTFYEKNDFRIKGYFEDFYDEGDDKVVYLKVL
ncbi:MAG: GNAT family N-acetyltransferase [Bacteroidales bacterium]|nr:GNAT family N-acetyltransferase [Bacteroidales bacterium]